MSRGCDRRLLRVGILWAFAFQSKALRAMRLAEEPELTKRPGGGGEGRERGLSGVRRMGEEGCGETQDVWVCKCGVGTKAWRCAPACLAKRTATCSSEGSKGDMREIACMLERGIEGSKSGREQQNCGSRRAAAASEAGLEEEQRLS